VTVIAYSSKHRILAADSRCSDATGMHLTSCRKIFRLRNGALLGTSGDSDERDVRDLLSKASPRKMPSRAALGEIKSRFEGLLVFPKGQVYVVNVWHREHEFEGEWAGSVDVITDSIVSVGCGYAFAYGAMEVGADPIKAVRAACRRDTACALPVQWEKLA
jgi:hypothetical protein